jgi:hypothetical protein
VSTTVQLLLKRGWLPLLLPLLAPLQLALLLFLLLAVVSQHMVALNLGLALQGCAGLSAHCLQEHLQLLLKQYMPQSQAHSLLHQPQLLLQLHGRWAVLEGVPRLPPETHRAVMLLRRAPMAQDAGLPLALRLLSPHLMQVTPAVAVLGVRAQQLLHRLG